MIHTLLKNSEYVVFGFGIPETVDILSLHAKMVLESHVENMLHERFLDDESVSISESAILWPAHHDRNIRTDKKAS